jgi:hypothetical protein
MGGGVIIFGRRRRIHQSTEILLKWNRSGVCRKERWETGEQEMTVCSCCDVVSAEVGGVAKVLRDFWRACYALRPALHIARAAGRNCLEMKKWFDVIEKSEAVS